MDLANVPISVDFSLEASQMAERITQLHKEVHDQIAASNAKYKIEADRKRRVQEFTEEDLVLIHLTKGCLPTGSVHKLQRKKFGPFEVLNKYGPNAYKIKLPTDYNINPIFNVSDIFLYAPLDTFRLAS